jgi:MOSC domain-containing protein YiiM
MLPLEPHLTLEQLEAGLAHIQASPRDRGYIEAIVCRPATNKRKVLQEAELDTRQGLVGDNWLARGFRKRPDGSAHPDMQLNIMNARAIALIANDKNRWQLAGDQLFVDFDLSQDHLPIGTRLLIGDAMIEVTAEPHLGCKKFSERFGRDATLFVNSALGKQLNLRGINARVIQPGKVWVGAAIRKFAPLPS